MSWVDIGFAAVLVGLISAGIMLGYEMIAYDLLGKRKKCDEENMGDDV